MSRPSLVTLLTFAALAAALDGACARRRSALARARGARGAAAFAWLERGRARPPSSRSSARSPGSPPPGRVLFVAVPGVQPVTVIVVAAGASLGARAGMAVGATAALVSNLFLGQGPWTPWQMLGWAGCGRPARWPVG